MLLEHGADASSKDPTGGTALHWAISQGWEPVVRVLIEHRANVLAETNEGVTPVRMVNMAYSAPYPEIVAMVKAEAVSRAKCVAFAMGHHERLGAGSVVKGLEPEVLRKVLEQE